MIDSIAERTSGGYSITDFNSQNRNDDELQSQNATGWISIVDTETWTYSSADSPTFTVTVPGNKTSDYWAGMKIKLTQTTVKYFIMTKDPSYSSGTGLTTLTFYGGTDYTLVNAAISNVCYSIIRAPYGFPMNPAKWTVEVTSIGASSKSSPTVSVWYHSSVGSLSISVPIGCWHLGYEGAIQGVIGSTVAGIRSTLSTIQGPESGTTGESDADLTCSMFGYVNFLYSAKREKILTISTKTPYYLNLMATDASMTSIAFRGDWAKIIIRARCAYL